jgi:acetyltransferase-like isoleucine patch superfamily enzyme
MSQIARSAIIHPNVQLGQNVTIGEFVILGEAPRNSAPGQLETIIGDGAVIRSHSVIYAGNVIGTDFQTGHHVMIRELNHIGTHVSIGTNSVIEHHIHLMDGVRIHSNVFIPEYSTLHEGAWIGPNVVITNALYPLSPNAKDQLVGATILAHAKIGANSTLLPGIVIGEYALVGAGSVVTKSIPARQVVVGNPAYVIKTIDQLPYDES